MEYTQLERDVLDCMAQHLDVPHLREQIAASVPTSREYTGHGFFTKLNVLGDMPAIRVPSPISGPVIEASGIDYGGAAILFLIDGRIDQLELYANGDRFAESVEGFNLTPWEESNKEPEATR